MSAPSIPEIGNRSCPVSDSDSPGGRMTIAIAAPNAAPADTPIRPGSANGFLNKP